MTDPVILRKGRLREQVRARRCQLSASERDAAAAGLAAQLAALVERRGADLVTCYLPTPTEPDTRPFLDWARTHGVRVLLPVTHGQGRMEWVADAGRTRDGRYGIPEPVGAPVSPAELARVRLILAPALAVSTSGQRLGQGGGYFDRMLAALEPVPPVFAVVFDHEVVGRLPSEPHDRPVDGVVTPSAHRALPA